MGAGREIRTSGSKQKFRFNKPSKATDRLIILRPPLLWPALDVRAVGTDEPLFVSRLWLPKLRIVGVHAILSFVLGGVLLFFFIVVL
jgi:hypothetical protein